MQKERAKRKEELEAIMVSREAPLHNPADNSKAVTEIQAGGPIDRGIQGLYIRVTALKRKHDQQGDWLDALTERVRTLEAADPEIRDLIERTRDLIPLIPDLGPIYTRLGGLELKNAALMAENKALEKRGRFCLGLSVFAIMVSAGGCAAAGIFLHFF